MREWNEAYLTLNVQRMTTINTKVQYGNGQPQITGIISYSFNIAKRINFDEYHLATIKNVKI